MERICRDVAQLKWAVEVYEGGDEFVIVGDGGAVRVRVVGTGFAIIAPQPEAPPVKVPSADLSPMMTGQ